MKDDGAVAAQNSEDDEGFTVMRSRKQIKWGKEC